MTHFVVTPAYGRDYKSAKAAKAAWSAGRDFEHASAMFTGGGAYINNADVSSGDSIQIRYAKLAKLTVIRIKD